MSDKEASEILNKEIQRLITSMENTAEVILAKQRALDGLLADQIYAKKTLTNLQASNAKLED